jgi:hypothetical protein
MAAYAHPTSGMRPREGRPQVVFLPVRSVRTRARGGGLATQVAEKRSTAAILATAMELPGLPLFGHWRTAPGPSQLVEKRPSMLPPVGGFMPPAASSSDAGGPMQMWC